MTQPEERASAIKIALVGDDEALAGALTRALTARGASPLRVSPRELIDEGPDHDLAVFFGSAAVDGGTALLARHQTRTAPVVVLVSQNALRDRIAAVRAGARSLALTRADEVVEKLLAPPERVAAIGWTSADAFFDTITKELRARLRLPEGGQVELGDAEALAGALDRVVQELEGRIAGREGVGVEGVEVSDLDWEDDPNTTQVAAHELERWRRLASRKGAPPAETRSSGVRSISDPDRTPTRPVDLNELLAEGEAAEKAKAEPDAANARAQSELRDEPRAEAKAEAKAESKAESKAEPRAESKAAEPAVPEPRAVESSRVEARPGSRWPWLVVIAILVALAAAALWAWRAPAAPPPARRPAAAPAALAPRQDVRQPTPEAPPGDEAPAGPIPSEESARRLSDEAVLEGLAHERAGRWEDARAAYDRALVAFAQNPHALAGLARERLAAEDAQAALRFAERASSFRRRRAEYRVLIGDAHRMAGDEAAARAEYEAALELDPNDAPALARLGRAAAPQPAP